MSFILDALKKSEIERQEQAGPSVAHIREAQPDARRTLWIAAIAGLLIVNFIALLIFAFRSPGEQETPSVAKDAVEQAPAAASSPAPPVRAPAGRSAPAREPDAVANREVRPLAAEAEPSPSPVEPSPALETPVSAAPSSTRPESGSVAADESASLPTFNELVIKGRLALPPLHLDIHVYSDLPASRFVFIEGRKYREGERLSAGPQVERITETGVVLSHQGERFLLPRM